MISYCLKAVRGCNDRFAFVLLLLCLKLPLSTSNLFTRLTRSLVQLVHSSTHITTYILLAIVFFVLYLCIVIRNEGMTNGVLMNQIIYNN